MKEEEYKKIKRYFISKRINIFVTVFIIIFLFINTIGLNPLFAFYNSGTSVSGNTFTAGTLAFHFDSSMDFTSTFKKGDSVSYQANLVDDGNIGFQYTASATDITGDSDLCSNLSLNANLNGNSVFSGSLSSFAVSVNSYSNPSIWNFIVILPRDAVNSLQNKTCGFKFTFNGWQQDLLFTQGFSNTAQINGSISYLGSGDSPSDHCDKKHGDGKSDYHNGDKNNKDNHKKDDNKVKDKKDCGKEDDDKDNHHNNHGDKDENNHSGKDIEQNIKDDYKDQGDKDDNKDQVGKDNNGKNDNNSKDETDKSTEFTGRDPESLRKEEANAINELEKQELIIETVPEAPVEDKNPESDKEKKDIVSKE